MCTDIYVLGFLNNSLVHILEIILKLLYIIIIIIKMFRLYFIIN